MIISNSIKDLTLTKSEVKKATEFIDTHKCPWYKRLFRKNSPIYIYYQDNNGIGTWTYVICKRCGKKYDITDYKIW